MPKKERPLSATDVKPVPEDKNETPRYRKVSGTYSLVHKDKPIRRERVLSKSTEAISPQVSKVSQTDQASLLESKPGTSKVEGSYQIVKSRTQKVRTEEVSLTTDVSAPRPKRGLKDRIQKMLGQSKTDIETSGDAWFGDKPEGDDYWTVVDDSQRDDRSILTLLFVFAFLTLVTGVLLWLLLG